MGLFRRRRGVAGPDGPVRLRAQAPASIAEAIAQAQATRAATLIPPEKLPPVWAARTLIADTMAQLQLVAVRGGQPRPTQPLIVQRPDPGEPRWRTFERLAMDLTGHGNAALAITAWDAADRPMAVAVMPWREVGPQFDELGRLVALRWHDRTWRVGPDCVHVPLNTDTTGGHPALGSSPLQACRKALSDLAYLWAFESSFYSESGVPPLAIKVPYRVDKTEADELRDVFMAAHQGRRVPAVVGGAGEVVPLGVDAKQAALVEAHAQAVADVARAFRIPPSLLNAPSGGSLTYSTTEQQFRAWLTTGLQAYLMRVEATFSDLLPYGTTARFDTSELLRSDFATRVQAYAVALGGSPWLAPDEVRAMEGRPPMPLPMAADPAAATAAGSDGAPATDPNLQGV